MYSGGAPAQDTYTRAIRRLGRRRRLLRVACARDADHRAIDHLGMLVAEAARLVVSLQDKEVTMSTWARRKERIATDPEFRARVYRHQVESRQRRREQERLGLGPVCQHVYRDGRSCWRLDDHRHSQR